MKKIFISVLMAVCSSMSFAQALKPDTLWFKYDDRFIANEYIPLNDVDSLEFNKTSVKRWKTLDTGKTYTYNTTTSTSSNSCYGHWFNTSGNVCNYDNTAAVFAEMYPDKYGCHVGQYPGHLTKGKTYTIRQAIIYTHTDGKEYKAIMEVHLKIN